MKVLIFGNSLVRLGDSTYPDLLKAVHDVSIYVTDNNPLLASTAKAVDIGAAKDSAIIIHAGCGDTIKQSTSTFGCHIGGITELLGCPKNSVASYFLETVARYITRRGSDTERSHPYATKEEFKADCEFARLALADLHHDKIIIVGINYLDEPDWRYQDMKTASAIMMDSFKEFNYIDLFKKELSGLTCSDGIHLTPDGHKYVYDCLMNLL